MDAVGDCNARVNLRTYINAGQVADPMSAGDMHSFDPGNFGKGSVNHRRSLSDYATAVVDMKNGA